MAATAPIESERITGQAATAGAPTIWHIMQWSASCGFGMGWAACQSFPKWPWSMSVFGGHHAEYVALAVGLAAAPHSSSHTACEHDVLCKAGQTKHPSMKSTNKTLFRNRFMFDEKQKIAQARRPVNIRAHCISNSHYGHLSWRAGVFDRRFGAPRHAAAGDIRPPCGQNENSWHCVQSLTAESGRPGGGVQCRGISTYEKTCSCGGPVHARRQAG